MKIIKLVFFVICNLIFHSFAYTQEKINQKQVTEFQSDSNQIFKPESLILPQEIWQFKEDGGVVNIISFSGAKFFEEDIKQNRFFNPSGKYILSGFLISNAAGLDWPQDCHFPRVPIIMLQGIKNSDGSIVLWAIQSQPIFGGVLNQFDTISTFEISNIKGKEGNLVTSYMRFTYAKNPFVAKRIKSKIIKIN